MADDERWVTSIHEAGHAVMRLLRSQQATDLYVYNGGTNHPVLGEIWGYCDGTGQPIRSEDKLLISLAGPAAEVGCLPVVDCSKSDSADFDDAREILGSCEYLRLYGNPPLLFVDSVEAALQRWFDRCCDSLGPYSYLVEALAEELSDSGHLPASRVRALANLLETGLGDIYESGRGDV
jgi:hypothetical protein